MGPTSPESCVSASWRRTSSPTSLPKSLLGKCFTRTGFENSFEFACFPLGEYGNIGIQYDGQIGCGRTHLTPLMRLKPPLKVVRGPNVDVAIAQLKKLYVPHRRDGLAMLMTARRPTFLRPPKRAPRRREALGPRAVLRETLYTPNRLRVSVHFVACHPKPKA